jgi:hypothetical protein
MPDTNLGLKSFSPIQIFDYGLWANGLALQAEKSAL